jgi:hypothetical protein
MRALDARVGRAISLNKALAMTQQRIAANIATSAAIRGDQR